VFVRDRASVGTVVLRRAEWPERGKGGYQVRWSQDVFEAIAAQRKLVCILCKADRLQTLPLSHLPALVPVSARDEDALILESFSGIFYTMNKFGERRMALHKHACIQRNVETLTQIRDSFGFALSTAIRQEYEWYALLLEIFEGLVGTRKRICRA